MDIAKFGALMGMIFLTVVIGVEFMRSGKLPEAYPNQQGHIQVVSIDAFQG